jgi:hypothetical protein
MATNTGPKLETQHPPLARDAQGNFVAIPEGTVAWRLCRQTTGRPKEVVGPDKRTLRVPLETTADELADMCGADMYRVYALDEVGKVLDYVVTVDVTRDMRELRNGAPDAALVPALRAAPAALTADLRFALEAMAQMMRVNSDALRAVTETQADCVKAIVSVRGFFRNAQSPMTYEPAQEHDDDESEDGDSDQTPQNKTIYDVLAPLAEHWAPSVAPFVSILAGGIGTKARPSGPAAAATGDADLASRPSWEFRDFVDLNYASAKAKAKKAAKQAGSGAAGTSTMTLQARVMADPKLMAHFLAIKSLLTANEIVQLLALGERMTDHQQEWLVARIGEVSADQAATMLRSTLAELSQANTSTEQSQ